MNFEFNEQQRLLKNAAEQVSKRELLPLLDSYPRDRPYPRELIMKQAQIIKPLGVLGARVPVEDGGAGLDYVSVGILWETLPLRTTLSTGADGLAYRIRMGGSQKLKDKFMKPLLEGEILAGSAISEPNCGSDPRAIQTKAVLDGDHYVINGTKIWSSNATLADILIAVVSMGRDEKGRNLMTRIIVERAVSPWEAREIDTLGLETHPLCEVFFDDCRVPAENVVGDQGDAHSATTATWLSERIRFGLLATKLSQRALDMSIQYAKDRVQFGKPIGSFQLIQNKLVDMYISTETSRLLCYKGLAAMDTDMWSHKESSAAKVYATEAAIKTVSDAIQIHGAYGITRENSLERMLRDVRMFTFPDGTTEINKLIVGRELVGIRAFA